MMQVIFETLRLATIVNGVLRKTTQEMELNGMIKKLGLFFSSSLPLKVEY